MKDSIEYSSLRLRCLESKGQIIRDSRGVAYIIGLNGEVIDSTRGQDFRVLGCSKNKEYSWVFSSQGILILSNDKHYWIEDGAIDSCYGESIPEYAEPFVLDSHNSFFAIYNNDNKSVVTKINKISGAYKQYNYPLKSYGGWLEKETLYLIGMSARKRIDEGKHYSFTYGKNKILKISEEGDKFKSMALEERILSKLLKKNLLEVLIDSQSLKFNELFVGLEPAYGQDEVYLTTSPSRGDFKAFSLLSYSNGSSRLIKNFSESTYVTMIETKDAIVGFYFKERSGLPKLLSLRRFKIEVDSEKIINDSLKVEVNNVSEEEFISYFRVWSICDKYVGIIETQKKMDIRCIYKISSSDTEVWDAKLLYKEQFGKEL